MHPPARNFRSGGHVFNEQLVAAARRRSVALTASEVAASEAGEKMREDVPCLRIWDSLFLEALGTRELAHTGEQGLLLHYLPSHDPTLDRSERLRLQHIEARAIEAASFVIATSRAHKAMIDGTHPGTPAFVCEPGVSNVFLAPRSAGSRPADGVLQLLTVANFAPAKGLMEIAFALSRLAHIDWRWHVVGDESRDAPYASRFDAAVRQYRLATRVVRHGALGVQAIAQLMDEADLFVCASRFEAYGMVLAEAAAKRLPAVTTEVGAAASLYSHDHTGLVCAVDDSAAFALHLERLMTDAALRRRFRANLRDARARTWDDALNDFMVAVTPYA